MQRLLLSCSALALLVFSGVVHGLWTDRWSDQVDLGEAVAGLDKLPPSVGDWHGEDIPREADPRSGLAGSLARRYTHTTTGRAVTLYLACGRPGPVSTHTPDVCYTSGGFEAEKKRRFQIPSTAAGAPAELWTSRFVRIRPDGQTNLRIFWGWLASGTWQAAENPRLAFASERVLHKLYVIREMASSEEALEGDACVEFMQELMPRLQTILYTEPK